MRSRDPVHERIVGSGQTARTFPELDVLGLKEQHFQHSSSATRQTPFRAISQSRRRCVLFRVSSRSRSPVYAASADSAEICGSETCQRYLQDSRSSYSTVL